MSNIDMDRIRKDVGGLLTSAEQDTPLNGVLVMVVSAHDDGPLVGFCRAGKIRRSDVMCGIEDIITQVLRVRLDSALTTPEVAQ